VKRSDIMRNRAGGLLIENGQVLLMHRIKNVDGEIKEYYVVPGGGMEGEEDIETATKRELDEEMGIGVELLQESPLFTLEEEKGNQYFSLIKKVSGEVGTGTGPEFNDPSYANRGVYAVEFVKLQDIINGKINMVPEKIKEEFIRAIIELGKPLEEINSNDLVSKKSVFEKEKRL